MFLQQPGFGEGVVAVAVWVVFVLADDDGPMFTVKAIVQAEGSNGTSGGSGSFTLPENEYGRIILAFYNVLYLFFGI